MNKLKIKLKTKDPQKFEYNKKCIEILKKTTEIQDIIKEIKNKEIPKGVNILTKKELIDLEIYLEELREDSQHNFRATCDICDKETVVFSIEGKIMCINCFQQIGKINLQELYLGAEN